MPAQPQSGFGHSWRRILVEIGAIVALVTLVVLGGLGLLRWLATRAVERLPVSFDRKLGAQLAEQVLASSQLCANDRALRAILDRLRPRLPEEFRQVRGHLLRGDDLNAFALPGGELFVLRGLLDAATRTEQVAGVVGHEIGHAVLRHGVRRIARQAGLSLLLALVLGGGEDQLSGLIAGSVRIGALRFDRDEEREADAFGVSLCARSGIDPRALAEFFGQLPSAPVAWLSTHPASQERRERLLATIAELRWTGSSSPLPSIEELRAGCR